MKHLFIANWKMHKTVKETVDTINELKKLLASHTASEVAVAPPFTSLYAASSSLQGSTVDLAAQNSFYEEKGAFTGEISPLMLKDLGVRYVILGHSERRQYFGETDEMVAKKVKKIFQIGLVPVLCIGETKRERDAGKTFEILDKQIKGSLNGCEIPPSGKLVVAYEPVWAIGTGDTATPEMAEDAHRFIREKLSTLFGTGIGKNTQILYGGSVKPDNAKSLMEKQDINGALVGGASLEAKSFASIIRF